MMPSSGKKREFEIMDDASPGNDRQQELAAVLSSLHKLRLEAIFHPKFENENINDRQIRLQIKERVRQGRGYLEVTLKHSGSLLLWSGGQRYYSKNSTGNRFTDVGEILLRQHFVRAFWKQEEATTPEYLEENYQLCSRFVQEHRLTLAFEVVTAVLGDHGAVPKRDFLILTAVADRSAERFYSTEELIELAQRFRLPHNDSWVFASAKSVDDLFSFYDDARETGLAQDVVEGLSNFSDTQVKSIYPHDDFQGEILEGIVIRFVSFQGRTDVLEKVNELSRAARTLQEQVPSELASCFDLVRGLPEHSSLVLNADIRKVFAEARAQEEDDMLRFDTALRAIFEQSSEKGRAIEHVKRPSDRAIIQAQMKALVESDDIETRRVAALVQSLSKLKARVDYSVVREVLAESTGSRVRWMCMIHVFYDSTFKKFRQAMKPGDMVLFRGFGVELGGGSDSSFNDKLQHVSNIGETTIQTEQDEDALMLKMKYLPYMVRTFGCRNGLRVIRQGGPDAFVKYTSDLLTKWQISPTARLKWQPFFLAWALYVERTETKGLETLPPLTDAFYLHHLQRFDELYTEGHFDQQLSSWHSRAFRGLVVVVAVSSRDADVVADSIAKELGGTQRIPSVNDVTLERMIGFREPGHGAVWGATVKDGLKPLRKLLKHGADSLSLVMIGCSDEDIASLNHPEDEKAQLQGMVKNWKKVRCPCVRELPASVLVSENSGDPDTGPVFLPNGSFHKTVSLLQGVSNSLPPFDSRPGVLVFFPGIPGCGKSSLLTDQTVKELRIFIASIEKDAAGRNRKLTVQSGDKTRQKFWPLVKQDRLMDRPCVYIADKNVPRQTWQLIAGICSATRGVAVPVLPCSDAVRTTTIQCFRKVDGDLVEREHYYPFSLQYLAVCMARVLERPAGDHAGGLDRGTARACMIMAKFFSLYRNLSGDEFLERMRSNFATEGALLSQGVEVPFFADDGGSKPLPSDLEEALVDLLQTQYGFEMRKLDTDKAEDAYIDELEKRLRLSIERHRDDVLGRTVKESVSQESFVEQLKERVLQVSSMDSYDFSSVSAELVYIKIVSIDIDIESLHSRLRLLESDEQLAVFWETVLNRDAVDEAVVSNRYQDKKFAQNPHVTMAHCKEESQADIRSAFESICGSTVKVTITALLWSAQVAALEVEITDETDQGKAVPRPGNAFSHITLWCQEGVSSFQSNTLPGLVETGEAHRVELKDAIVLYGAVSFWSADKH